MFANRAFLEKCDYRAEWSEAPSMYEMEGASSGFATPGWPVTRLPRRRAPPAGTGDPHEVPVSRLLGRSGGSPDGSRFQR
jgi:hypothetical protein